MATLYTHHQLPQNSFSRGTSPSIQIPSQTQISRTNESQNSRNNNHQNFISPSNNMTNNLIRSSSSQGFKRNNSQQKSNTVPTEQSQPYYPRQNMYRMENCYQANLQLHSNKNTSSSQNINTSILTSNSVHYNPQNIHSQNNLIDSSKQQRVFSNQRPLNNLGQNELSTNQHQQNASLQFFRSPVKNTESNHQNNHLNQVLSSSQIPKSNKSSQSQMNSINQNEQQQQNKNIKGSQHQNLQLPCQKKQKSVHFEIENDNSSNNNITESKDDLINSNTIQISTSSIPEEQSKLKDKTHQQGRANNFLNSLQTKQTSFFTKSLNDIQHSSRQDFRNNSLNITSPSLTSISQSQTNINPGLTQLNSNHDSKFQESQTILQKNELRNMIKAKQRELQELKCASKNYRQTSVEAYNEINQKISNTQNNNEVKNKRLVSTSKLNTFLLNKFSSQNNECQQNFKNQCNQQSS